MCYCGVLELFIGNSVGFVIIWLQMGAGVQIVPRV